MANSTTPLTFSGRVNFDRKTVVIKSGVTVVRGGLLSMDTTTGIYENAQDAANKRNQGIFLNDEQGNPTLLGDGAKKGIIHTGCSLEQKNVVGVDGADDHGKFVYAESNQDLTLTANTNGRPSGHVHKHLSGTLCEVLLYGEKEIALLPDA